MDKERLENMYQLVLFDFFYKKEKHMLIKISADDENFVFSFNFKKDLNTGGKILNMAMRCDDLISTILTDCKKDSLTDFSNDELSEILAHIIVSRINDLAKEQYWKNLEYTEEEINVAEELVNGFNKYLMESTEQDDRAKPLGDKIAEYLLSDDPEKIMSLQINNLIKRATVELFTSNGGLIIGLSLVETPDYLSDNKINFKLSLHEVDNDKKMSYRLLRTFCKREANEMLGMIESIFNSPDEITGRAKTDPVLKTIWDYQDASIDQKGLLAYTLMVSLTYNFIKGTKGFLTNKELATQLEIIEIMCDKGNLHFNKNKMDSICKFMDILYNEIMLKQSLYIPKGSKH